MASSLGNSVVSGSFSQPTLTLGSLASPVSSASPATLQYVAGITKYVFYTNAPASGVPTAAGGQLATVAGCPPNLLATTSLSGCVDWCLTGLAVGAPIITPYIVSSISWINTSQNATIPTTLKSEISMKVQNAATVINSSFTGGTPVFKYVINLTQDL